MDESNGLILNHQFGLRQRHSKIEQTCGMVLRMSESLENKQNYCAAFIDISQAFNK
jgi:hypothetical protein